MSGGRKPVLLLVRLLGQGGSELQHASNWLTVVQRSRPPSVTTVF